MVPGKKIVVGWSLAAVGALLGGALVFESGCYDHNVCDGGGVADFGGKSGEGRLASPDVWETAPQTEDWLPFPRKRAWFFLPRGLEGRGYVRINAYVSPDRNPAKSLTQYTTAAGNLGEIRVQGDAVAVINDTCEDFFVRVVIEAYPSPPVLVPSRDSGTPPPPDDAGVTDAAPE